MWFWLTLLIIWLPVTLFFPTRIIGKKNLIKGKSIWACNHRSNMDILLIATKSFTRIYALGKAELFKNKFFGGYLKRLGCIKVNRGQADINSVKTVLRVLKDKQKPIVIFPTGTRKSTPDEVENLKNGTVMFALKSQSPIVPMVFVRKPKLFRRNRLVIGEPIDITPYLDRAKDKNVYAEINDILSKRLDQMVKKYGYTKKEKNKKAKQEV